MIFNCPHKFNNLKRKSPKENRFKKYRNNKDKNESTNTETVTAATVEFAGYAGMHIDSTITHNKKSHTERGTHKSKDLRRNLGQRFIH